MCLFNTDTERSHTQICHLKMWHSKILFCISWSEISLYQMSPKKFWRKWHATICVDFPFVILARDIHCPSEGRGCTNYWVTHNTTQFKLPGKQNTTRTKNYGNSFGYQQCCKTCFAVFDICIHKQASFGFGGTNVVTNEITKVELQTSILLPKPKYCHNFRDTIRLDQLLPNFWLLKLPWL